MAQAVRDQHRVRTLILYPIPARQGFRESREQVHAKMDYL